MSINRSGMSTCLRRVRCPVHGVVTRRIRQYSGITPAEVKRLVPSMQDHVIWKWDQVTMAMSGGVDSAVALRILSEWPIDLNVIFMRNWDSLLSESSESDPDRQTSYAYPSSDPSSSKMPNLSPCGWQKDWESVQRVCAHVGIPEERVRLVDLSKEYWTRVFEPAINVWQEGGTPNPDVACNREIKFGALLEHVPVTDRSFLATGHYARVKRVPHAVKLCRADDETKDQTFFLSAISEPQLKRAVFPLAGIKKEDTRRLARYYGLPNAEKEESMGLCFVGERGKFGNFVSQYIPKPATQGYLVDDKGKRIAPHDGVWHYTIGQKARIGGQDQPMFVAKKCVGESKQDILVVPGTDHPALLCTRLHTHDFHWIAGKVPKGIVPGGRKRAYVQLRHRMEPVPAVISHDWNGGGLTIELLSPVHGVAAGQVCAIYYLKWCVGSGVIKQTWTSDTHPIKRWKAIKEAKGEPEGYFGAEEMERLQVKVKGEEGMGEMVEMEEMDEDEDGEGSDVAVFPEPVTVYAEEVDAAEARERAEEKTRTASEAPDARQMVSPTNQSTDSGKTNSMTASPSSTSDQSSPVRNDYPAPASSSSRARSLKHSPTTAEDFWSSAADQADTSSPNPMTQDRPSPSFGSGRPKDPMKNYYVLRSPALKGFGAPAGYTSSTAFGSVSRELMRSALGLRAGEKWPKDDTREASKNRWRARDEGAYREEPRARGAGSMSGGEGRDGSGETFGRREGEDDRPGRFGSIERTNRQERRSGPRRNDNSWGTRRRTEYGPEYGMRHDDRSDREAGGSGGGFGLGGGSPRSAWGGRGTREGTGNRDGEGRYERSDRSAGFGGRDGADRGVRGGGDREARGGFGIRKA